MTIKRLPLEAVFWHFAGHRRQPSWNPFKAGCWFGDGHSWFFGLRGVWGLLRRFSEGLVAAVLVSSGVGREAEVGG